MTAPTFSFAADYQGDHVHITVRVGVEGQRAKCGELVMRRSEWESFRERLLPGSEADQVVVPVVPDLVACAEDRLRAVVKAIHACQGEDRHYISPVAVFNPTPDIIEWAVSRTDPAAWKENQHEAGTGSLYVGHLIGQVHAGDVVIHDVPKSAIAPREPAPLPACTACGSTACPDDCPCGAPPVDTSEMATVRR